MRGGRLFTSSGTMYYHGFNLTLCNGRERALPTCVNNVTAVDLVGQLFLHLIFRLMPYSQLTPALYCRRSGELRFWSVYSSPRHGVCCGHAFLVSLEITRLIITNPYLSVFALVCVCAVVCVLMFIIYFLLFISALQHAVGFVHAGLKSADAHTLCALPI